MTENKTGFTGVISPRNTWSYFGPLLDDDDDDDDWPDT